MSNATFLTSRILKACQGFLDAQTKRMKDTQEKHIQEYMRNKVYIFFGRTFTREEAIKNLEADIWNDYGMAHFGCNYVSFDIRALKTLCEKTDAAYMDIDAETAYKLRYYL